MTDRQPLPKGIQLERGRPGYFVEVRVRPQPKRRRRFPADTPIAEMLAWRDEQRADLLEAERIRTLAVAAEAAAEGRAPAGKRPAAGPTTTFRQDVETFLADVIRPDMHPNNKSKWARYLRLAAATDFGRYPRALITGDKWAALVALWARRGIPSAEPVGGRRRTVAPAPLESNDTINGIRTVFVGFYRDMNAGLKLPNPAADIPRRKPTEPEMRGIPMADAIKIVQNIGAKPGSRTQARLMLMCVLGLRPCEIMRIKPATDWHRAGKRLQVRTAKDGIARTLGPLDPYAVGALETLDRARNGWGTFTSSPMAKMFHAAVARAGLQALEPLVPYDLRHSFGTEAYRLTGDIKAVGAALGQKTLRITERYVLAAVSTRVESLITQLSASLPPVTPAKRKRGKLRAV